MQPRSPLSLAVASALSSTHGLVRRCAPLFLLGILPSLGSAQYVRAVAEYARVQAVQNEVRPSGDRNRQLEIAETIVEATEEMADYLSDTGEEVGAPVRDRIRREVEGVRNQATRTRDAARVWENLLDRQENHWEACEKTRTELKALAGCWQQLQNEIQASRRVLSDGFAEWAKVRRETMQRVTALKQSESELQKKAKEALEKFERMDAEVDKAQEHLETVEEAFDEAYSRWEEACKSGDSGAENEKRLFEQAARLHVARGESRARLAGLQSNCRELEKERDRAEAEWDKAQAELGQFLKAQDVAFQVIQLSNDYLNWTRQFAAEFPAS